MPQEMTAQHGGVAPSPGLPSPNGDEETHCPICGRDGEPSLRRFGYLFCSEDHVDQYASERRARAYLAGAGAPAVEPKGPGTPAGMACGTGTKGGLRKMGWCLAGGAGVLVALPLLASGGLAAAAGSALSVAAVLACPIGMYFMMRGMMKMNQMGPKDSPEDKGSAK